MSGRRQKRPVYVVQRALGITDYETGKEAVVIIAIKISNGEAEVVRDCNPGSEVVKMNLG